MRLLLNKRKVNDTWKIFCRLLFLKWDNEIISDKGNTKISIIEVYLLKYYFESHLKYKRRYLLHTKHLPSIKYYGILRRYNWCMA
jgi:hypothetical protein